MGQICTFFGHSFCILSDEKKQKLNDIIEDLILNHDVDEFWIGEYGDFDDLSRRAVWSAKKKYPHIKVTLPLVYPYKDQEEKEYLERTYDYVFHPIGIEDGPPKFTITRRNKYVAENCDYVVCYVDVKRGGAYRAVRRAKTLGKHIINLYEGELH